MSFKNLELLIAKLEQLVLHNLFRESAESASIKETEIDSLFARIADILRQEQLEAKKLPIISTVIRQIPLAIAILDRELNYLAVSDRWIENGHLTKADSLDLTHHKIFPELSVAWEENRAKNFSEGQKVIEREDCLVRDNGTIDWFAWQLRPWRDLEGNIGGAIVFAKKITERKLLQQKIQSTEEQMRAVFASMNELVFTAELDSNSISIFPTRFMEIYDEEVIEQVIEQLQAQLFDSTEEESNLLQTSVARVLATKTTVDFEHSLQLTNSTIWFSVNVSPIADDTAIWIARDVTDRKQTEAEIHYIEQELAQITLQSIGDGVITTDKDGRVQYLNPSAESLTGWSVREAQGKSFAEVFCLTDRFDHQPTIDLLDEVVHNHEISKLTAKSSLLAHNGTRHEIEGLVSPIVNLQQQLIGTVTVFRDVTHARKMARRLSWQASHDSLTKLYNRRKFEEYVVKAIASARQDLTRHTLCYLDLDRFKIVNDTCGHAAGDRLLYQVTKLLKKRIRNADIFARLGGDEFGIVFHQCPIELAVKCANELRQLIEDFRFVWQDKVFRISVSIGLVEIEPTTEKLSNLLNSADAACYLAKQQGGNYVYLCRERDLIIAQQHGERRWIETIERALERNEFCLYAQKIVPIREGDVFVGSLSKEHAHYEVFLRLKDSEGIILPGAFLPAAERYGLMPAIDRWVISNFLASYESYCQSLSPSALANSSQLFTINLSGASINNQEFGNFLRSQFDRYSIPLHTICFEITETVAITNLERANILMNQLKALGCSIALDDFGSGMSSLTYLKNLPIDYLKIDGSFVTNITHDEIDYAAVECFNHISQIMQIETIAEFVENQEILQLLQQIGVDFAQGYGIERPKPLVWQ